MRPRSAPLPDLPVFLVSMAGLVALWAVAAWITADASVMPGPAEVLRVLADEVASGEMQVHMAATLMRVAAAFGLAMGAGVALGLALGLSARADRFFGPWLTVLLNIPALVVIVLCYLWIGLNEVAAVLAVAVNKLPMVAVTVREGVRALDRQVAEMAQSFGMSPVARLRHVILPQLAPFLLSATRNGLAIIWKIVLVVEFLGRPNGIGFQVHLYFQMFETAHVLAYALSFAVLMLCVEMLVIRGVERRAGRWRRALAGAPA